MKCKTIRKLKSLILNICFVFMTFLYHLSIFLKKFRVGRHENHFFFEIAIKTPESAKNSGTVGLEETQLFLLCLMIKNKINNLFKRNLSLLFCGLMMNVYAEIWKLALHIIIKHSYH